MNPPILRFNLTKKSCLLSKNLHSINKILKLIDSSFMRQKFDSIFDPTSPLFTIVKGNHENKNPRMLALHCNQQSTQRLDPREFITLKDTTPNS